MKHLSIVAGVALLSFSTALLAQQPAANAPAPAFEVASVKPSDPTASGPLAQVPIILPPVGGRFSATNVPLRILIRSAWQLQDFQLAGGPQWMTTARFDILATAGAGFTGGMNDVMPMVKTLIEDRFKLKSHFETRELAVYTLVVAREDGTLGDKLKVSTADCANAEAELLKRVEAVGRGGLAALAKPGEPIRCSITPLGLGGFKGEGQRMGILVTMLNNFLGRSVIDKTGLTDRYDFELTFDPQILLQMQQQLGVRLQPGITLPASDNPPLMTALQEQLGLKLESHRAPVQVMVIDSAELPEPN